MTDEQQPLIIKDWQTAVADSPHLGHGLMRNIDIEAFPGALKAVPALASYFIAATSPTFTADASTDICTVGSDFTGGATYGGLAVTFTTTGTLPAGLSTGTTYFLIRVSSTTFKVATSYKNSVGSTAGTAIDITDSGTGVHTVVPVAVGQVRQTVNDPRADIQYFLDTNGRVWFAPSSIAYLLTGNTLTNAGGRGLQVFRTSDGAATYLFVFRNALIDVINVYGTTNIETPVWNSAWQSMNTAAGTQNVHFSIVAVIDNNIYFCDDRYLGSIHEVAGQVFDPTNGATYTYNNQALKLPQGEIANCVEELGLSVYVGGATFNKIYPWDRFSSSFNYPLAVPEFQIFRLKNAGSTIYILAGTRGNIYTTQGTFVKFLKKVPDFLINNTTAVQPNPLTWGDIAIRNNAIIFGLAGQTAANNGVYLLYPDGRILQDNTPSTGGTNALCIFAKNDFYVVGYASGADRHTNSRYGFGTFAAVYISQFYRVGNKTQKAGYSQIEVHVAKPTSIGEIRVSWRADESSSFTVLDTYSADGTTLSWQTDIGLIDIENIQVQVEFDGDLEIMEVQLTP